MPIIDLTMETKGYRLAAIMYTSIHGFSGMLGTNEPAALALLARYNTLARKLIAEHAGSVTRTIGDSFLVTFDSVTDAVRCALRMRQEFAVDSGPGDGPAAKLAIGIHLGDIRFFEGDAIGEGISIAHHLHSLAHAGSICISKEVYDQVRAKLAPGFIPIGRTKPAQSSRDVTAFELADEGATPTQNNGTGGRFSEDAGSAAERESRRTEETTDRTQDDVETGDRSSRVPHPGEFDLSANVRRRIERSVERKISRRMDRLARRHGGAHTQTGAQDEWRIGKASWNEYAAFARSEADRSTSNFAAHLTSYLIVNGGLFIVNFLTFFGYKWFLWPLAAWGIGIVCHWITARMKRRRKRAVERLSGLSAEQQKAFHALYITERNFAYHAGAYGSVIGFLFFTNAFTWLGFPWFLIVAGAWAIGLALHASVFIPKRLRLRKRLKELLGGVTAFVRGKRESAYAGASETVREAFALRDAIVREIDSYDRKKSPFGADIKPLLEQYTNRIVELDARSNEIDSLVRSIPMDGLAADRAKLETKIAQAESDYMQKEYAKAIEEIDRHEHSFRELNNQKEIIGLRLASSVNNLKQLSIDLARMKSMSAAPDGAAVSLMKDKTKELSQYLDDLRAGYEELDQDL